MNTATIVKSRAERVQKVRAPKSGVEAWLFEDYAVPLVAFDFAFRGGGAQDPATKTGLCYMLAAMMDEGAGEMDADAFHSALDDIAAEISFSADRDSFRGRLKTLVRHLDAAANLLRLALTSPRFDADALERVRGQMIAGLKSELKDPDALAAKAWREAAFGEHPYAHSGCGTLDSVPTLQRADVVGARAALMARDTLKISVVGAISATTLATLLDSVFGDLPAHGNLRKIPDVTMSAMGSRVVVDVDVPQTTIRFGMPGLDRHDRDYWTGIVVNHILGGGVFSARLFREVREKRGLAYSVHSQLVSLDHASMFSGGTSTKNERALESLEVIEAEIRTLCADGPTADELDKAKKYLTGSYALRFDTSTKIAGNLTALQLDGYDPGFLDERNRRIDAVSLADAKRVSKRLFEGNKLTVAAAGRPVGM